MRRNWQQTGKPQPTRLKGRGKQGKPYKLAQIPKPKKRDAPGPPERDSKPAQPPSDD